MSDPYVGEIRLFGFPRVPTGWLACDGSQRSIAEYEVLYAVIGTTFGGDGVNVFNVPDLRGRVPISQGTGAGGLTPRVLGQAAGAPEQTLLDQNTPRHSHPLIATTNAGTTATPGDTVHLAAANPDTFKLYAPDPSSTVALAACVVPAGSNMPHDNMMPSLAGNFCIAWVGVFPSQN